MQTEKPVSCGSFHLGNIQIWKQFIASKIYPHSLQPPKCAATQVLQALSSQNECEGGGTVPKYCKLETGAFEIMCAISYSRN